jgi:AbrB family looped-hinge helix DNA binding protein
MTRNWKLTKKEFSAEVISGGRITIPKTVRRILKLKEGSVVNVTLESQEVDDKGGMEDA